MGRNGPEDHYPHEQRWLERVAASTLRQTHDRRTVTMRRIKPAAPHYLGSGCSACSLPSVLLRSIVVPPLEVLPQQRDVEQIPQARPEILRLCRLPLAVVAE